MGDLIQLLPERVANQIAAGEVVQRPASVVKELLENAIDAGATSIQLIVEDAGKGKIQIIDNGVGMSETDARLAFERHATSKIKSAEDLFALHTKGFRGEALASIGAVAQVVLKTKTAETELGTQIRMEGSKVVEQKFCDTPVGSNFEVKNLFYNIPARRNFLKSNNVEIRHIIDEFERVALPHFDIHFSLHHNGHELFNLPPTSFRKRIVNIFGSKFNEKLVPVEERTPLASIHGFICKPEFSKKTRGEQFFFANSRFIKSHYLHKAVCLGCEGLIQEDNHPSYFLFLDIEPQRIDVNIHPTKTEIKFEDEKAIFTIIKTAIKHAFGQYNIAPSLDFEVDQQFQIQPPKAGTQVEPPGIYIDPTYNPFGQPKAGKGKSTQAAPISRHSREWESVLNQLPEVENVKQEQIAVPENYEPKRYTQIGQKYILGTFGDGLILLHQNRAHQRVLYEQILKNLERAHAASQQLLFPRQIEFPKADFGLLEQVLPALRALGFDLEIFGKSALAFNGLPLFVEEAALEDIFDHLIENLRESGELDAQHMNETLAKSLAFKSAIKVGQSLVQAEMQQLVDELFATTSPYLSPYGKTTIANLSLGDLDKSFQ